MGDPAIRRRRGQTHEAVEAVHRGDVLRRLGMRRHQRDALSAEHPKLEPACKEETEDGVVDDDDDDREEMSRLVCFSFRLLVQ